MGYSEDRRDATCPACGTRQWLIVCYAGYGPANDRETGECLKCGHELASEKCLVIKTEAMTPERRRGPAGELVHEAKARKGATTDQPRSGLRILPKPKHLA